MKNILSTLLFLFVLLFFKVQINAQVSAGLQDSLSKLLNKKVLYVGVNKMVKYENVNEGKAFYTETVFEKNKSLDTIFIRNDSLITKYKEEHHNVIYYEGKKRRNLHDPAGYLSVALVDLKFSIAFINKGNWEGALLGGYQNSIVISPKNKNTRAAEFPYRRLDFAETFNRYTSKNAKELDDANSILSLFNLYILQIYNGQLEIFKTKANQQNNNQGISEEQRKLIVQANLANDEKMYEQAIELYYKSLQFNEFNYPQGYYNIALIAAQLEDYPLAIFNLKKYLILDPNAEDARRAQDKIYEWEFKINN